MAPAQSIVLLIGLRGSGKSTLARLLADHVQAGFVDLDVWSAQRLGEHNAGAAIQKHGIEAFRTAETEALGEVLGASGPMVVALGGGTPTAPGAADLINTRKDAGTVRVLYLRGSAKTLRDRLAGADNQHRPPLVGDDVIDEVGELLTQRDGLYTELADAVIEIDGLSLGDVLERLAAAVG